MARPATHRRISKWIASGKPAKGTPAASCFGEHIKIASFPLEARSHLAPRELSFLSQIMSRSYHGASSPTDARGERMRRCAAALRTSSNPLCPSFAARPADCNGGHMAFAMGHYQVLPRWTQVLSAERAPSIHRSDTRVRSIFCFTCSKVHWAGFLSGRHLRMDVP